MNERIRELAEQAEKLKRDEVSYRERLHNRYCTGDMEEEIFREKFAELIIRECAEICKKQSFHYAKHYNKGSAASAADVCRILINHHFGVK